jgi:hypothetical protein
VWPCILVNPSPYLSLHLGAIPREDPQLFLQGKHRAFGRAHTRSRVATPVGRHQLPPDRCADVRRGTAGDAHAATLAEACPPLQGRVLQRGDGDGDGDGGAAHVRGRTAGGNLTCLATLVGSSAWASLDGAILVLEDVHEEPYRLDRMYVSVQEHMSSVWSGVRRTVSAGRRDVILLWTGLPGTTAFDWVGASQAHHDAERVRRPALVQAGRAGGGRHGPSAVGPGVQLAHQPEP